MDIPTFHARRQANAHALMRWLCQSPVTSHQSPVVSIKQVATHVDSATNTASALVTDFVKLGILRPLSGRQRDRLYIFDE